ncbi:hypothetical protein Tco_1087090 [Tanacetum coccineum]
MSSATSIVTYTSVYTDSEPGRAFWEPDDEEAQRTHRHRQFFRTRMSMSSRLRSGPILPVDSPTAESPRYVTESDLEEDPEECEDDETEDGPVDYPMDGGDNGDDDDGVSSGDDADEDEDD